MSNLGLTLTRHPLYIDSEMQSNDDSNDGKAPMRRSCKSTIPDLLMIIIIYSIAMVLEWSTSIHPYEQVIPGYDSGPRGTNYNYGYPKRDSTIPTPTMFLICFLFWSLLIFINGLILWRKDSSFTIKIFLNFLYLVIRIVMFSFAVTSLLTDIIKKSVGSVRPYYLTLAAEINNGEEFSVREVDNARQSFISGHSSESWSMLFLLSIYLYNAYSYTMKCKFTNQSIAPYSCSNPHSYFLGPLWNILAPVPLLSIVLIFIPSYVALYVSLSRITDYKHTATDITAGALLGAFVAFLSYLIHYDEMYRRFDHKHSTNLHHGIKQMIDMATYTKNDDHGLSAKSHAVHNVTPTQEIDANEMDLDDNTNNV